MSNIIKDLSDRKIITPPTWLPTNTMYLTIMGSIAFGVSEDHSDFDVYGYAIPPKDICFPHLAGEIPGFGTPKKLFEQYQHHHVFDPDALGGKGREYDFTIFGLVRYFQLCLEGNPNTIDSLFVAQSCILHSTAVSELVRDNRKLFLSKALWPRYKGYAYSQLHKSDGKNPKKGSKRHKLREKHGMDSKFLYHVVRLLSEIEQILLMGDLDLQEKGRREHMKAIRRGDVSEAQIKQWASDKELQLEKLYHESKLPEQPSEAKIREVLLQCLESHYGTIENCVSDTGWPEKALKDIDNTLNKIRNKLYS